MSAHGLGCLKSWGVTWLQLRLRWQAWAQVMSSASAVLTHQAAPHLHTAAAEGLSHPCRGSLQYMRWSAHRLWHYCHRELLRGVARFARGAIDPHPD